MDRYSHPKAAASASDTVDFPTCDVPPMRITLKSGRKLSIHLHGAIEPSLAHALSYRLANSNEKPKPFWIPIG